jgi:hypothetical protein
MLTKWIDDKVFRDRLSSIFDKISNFQQFETCFSYYKKGKNRTSHTAFCIKLLVPVWRDELLQGKQRNPMKAYALMTGILSQLVGSILIGIFGGKWIDGKLETFPLFLIIGLLLGLATGIYAMIRLVQQFFSGDQ